jgi:ABC-type amino acid transport substrate-binding protein
MRKIIESPIPALPPTVPPAVDDIVQTATAKNPASRYTDAGHMAAWLRHVLVEAAPAAPLAPTGSGGAGAAHPVEPSGPVEPIEAVAASKPNDEHVARMAPADATHPAATFLAGGNITATAAAGTQPNSFDPVAPSTEAAVRATATESRSRLWALAPVAVLIVALAFAGWLVARGGDTNETADAPSPIADGGGDDAEVVDEAAAADEDERLEPAAPAAPATVAPAPTLVATVEESAGGSYLATSAFADAIRRAGVIRIGINEFLGPPLGGPAGFERALIDELIPRLFGSDVAVELISLTAADRFVALDTGDIDLLVRNTTRTSSREELATFTNTYFLDGLSFGVRPGTATSLPELSGVVGTIAGSTFEANTIAVLSAAGASVRVDGYEGSDAMIGAYNSGQVDAVTLDFSALLARRFAGELDAEVLWADFAFEPMAAAVPLGEEEFADEVDAAIVSIIDDGTWLEIYRVTFGDDPPYTTAEMRAAPFPDR